MFRDVRMYILIFFIYSFAGWCIETFGGIYKEKKIINRGFLIGPYCPVYGVGVVLISILLKNYTDDMIVLYVLATLICGSLEYLTSYYMEKLFNARWWDYHNFKFNINGRVCLETLIPFGVVSIVILKIFNPAIINYLNNFSDIQINIITGILSFIFIVDFCISFVIILSFRGTVFSSKDNTEEISQMVKDKKEELGENVLEKTGESIIKVGSGVRLYKRKLKLKSLKYNRKFKYYSTRKLKKVLNSANVTQEKIKDKFDLEKNILNDKLKMKKIEVENMVKLAYSEIDQKQKELTIGIKEKFSQKSYLHRRLMKAFPNMKIKNKKHKNLK